MCWTTAIFNCSSQSTGGASQRYESWCNTASRHTVQSPANRSTPADVRKEHPKQTGQQGQWDTHTTGKCSRTWTHPTSPIIFKGNYSNMVFLLSSPSHLDRMQLRRTTVPRSPQHHQPWLWLRPTIARCLQARSYQVSTAVPFIQRSSPKPMMKHSPEVSLLDLVQVGQSWSFFLQPWPSINLQERYTERTTLHFRSLNCRESQP